MRHSNIFRIILSCVTFLGIGFNAAAYVPTYYTSNSKLNTGRWVKIKVTQTGMHEITYDQLREMGFSDPSKVSVYGYGGVLLSDDKFKSTLPDDLPAQPVYRTDDKVIFYGEADLRVNIGNSASQVSVQRNYYSTAGYYFLSEDATVASSAPTNISFRSANTLQREYHTCLLYQEPEFKNPTEGGALFFGPDFLDEPLQTFTFNAPDPYDPANQTATFKYNFVAKVAPEMPMSVAYPADTDILTTNNRTVTIITPGSVTCYTDSYGDATLHMRENGDSSYSFTFSIPTGFKPSYAAIDNVFLSYPRKNNVAGHAQLRMTFLSANANINFVLSGANPNTIVWNITNPVNIMRHRTIYTDSTSTLTGSFEKTYSFATTGHASIIAFDPTKELYKVEYVEEVENQNIHINEAPNMLIITNDECQPHAERLAQAHRDIQGLSVLVVNQREIFNEFSSGTPSAMGYRRLVKMLYDRNSSKFKYLLLFGGGVYDNRGIIFSTKDRLLTFQAKYLEDSNSPSTAYCADSYFGKVSDTYDPQNVHNEPMLIAVGRIPAGNGGDASSTVDKMIEYLQNPPTQGAYNRALLASDDGDNNSHLFQSQALADTIVALAPQVTVTRVYNSMYPITDRVALDARNAIIQALSLGQGYFCYTGHGKPDSFTGESLWNKVFVANTEYANPPIALLATCDSYSFDHDDDGIAENMLFKTGGGMISIVGASRTVFKDLNQYLSVAFAAELFSATDDDKIGDIYRRAYNNVVGIGSRDLSVNTCCFNLAGNPALPIYVPTLNVETTSINDQDATGNTKFELYPLADNIIEGRITDSEGNTLTDFNGSITLSLYDAPDTVITYERGTNPVDSSKTVICDEDLLAETATTVINGIFKTKLAIPASQRPGISNRLTYFATSDDKTRRAAGIFYNIIIAEYDETQAIADNTPPVISECYLNDPTFVDGDYVNSDVTLHATILPDQSGLNITTGTLGYTTKLILDNNLSYPEVRMCLITDQDGTTTISYPISGLTDGRHTLTLSVADNAGNRTSQTISFVVINRSAQAQLVVTEKPARTEATFSLNHNFYEEPSGRLVIENRNGNTVFTKENCTFPYTWNLQDSDGNRVIDGNYKAYVILNGDKQYGNTDRVEVIVIK